MSAQIIRPDFRPRPRPVMDVAAEMRARLDNMVRLQMGAYPDHWTEAEKRECAERYLFGPSGGDAA